MTTLVRVTQNGKPTRLFATDAPTRSQALYNVRASQSFWNRDTYTLRVVVAALPPAHVIEIKESLGGNTMWSPETLQKLNEKFEEKLRVEEAEGEAEFEVAKGAQ